MSDTQRFNLSDEFISQVAKLLQLAMLTGTSIHDNLRLVQVIPSEDGKLVLTDEYKKSFEANILKMLAEAEDIKEDMRSTIVQA
jgi:hypothetical protein